MKTDVKRTRLLTITALLFGLSLPALAAERECTPLGDGPEIPNGAEVTEAELVTSQKAVKEYVAQGEFYIQCLKATEVKLGEDITEDQQQRILLAYDQTVEKMHQTSDAFNAAVREFKGK